MKRKISKSSTIEEVAATVCETLWENGIQVVLTGGSVVSIYSDNEYESYDLDFILLGLGKKVDSVINDLGFSKERGRHFIHPETSYFVEFPGNTFAIGSDLNTEIVEKVTSSGVLRLLSPTDCVKDRLAAYYHWNDRQGLNQAVMVANRHPVSLEKIRRWSKSEGFQEKFLEFKNLLKR